MTCFLIFLILQILSHFETNNNFASIRTYKLKITNIGPTIVMPSETKSMNSPKLKILSSPKFEFMLKALM